MNDLHAEHINALSSLIMSRMIFRHLRNRPELIEQVAAGAGRVPREEWHHGLLHAAEMVRDLHIVANSGTDITIVESAD